MPTRAQGSSYKYTVGRTVSGAPVDLTGYTLQVRVISINGDPTGIDRMVTELSDDNLSFVVNITPAETLPLDIGEYKICNKLASASISYSREQEIDLNIRATNF